MENIYNLPFSRNPLDPKNLKAYKMLLDIQKKNNYDIVHVHTPIAAIYGRLLKLKFPNIKLYIQYMDSISTKELQSLIGLYIILLKSLWHHLQM